MIYLLFGACVFYHIEHGAETTRRAKELEERININGMYSTNCKYTCFQNVIRRALLSLRATFTQITGLHNSLFEKPE